MSEENHDTLVMLRAQYAELCRRIDELTVNVRAEQAETREEMRRGFAHLDKRYNGVDGRVRTLETADTTRKEQLSTWRLWAVGTTAVSGIVAGLIAFAKELAALLR